MAGFISQESIDEVTNRTDMIQLVNEYVPLVPRGAEFWGCCPFHHEKTPSFSVSPDKKFYYCFGCHASGNAYRFLMEMEKISYPEAIERLAKKAGVSLQYKEGGAESQKVDQKAKLKEEYKNLYNRVTTSFHYMLLNTDQGKFALDYIKKRGITDETIERFKLGYSPSDRKWLKKFLLKKNYTNEFLNDSGLFSKKYPDFSFFSDRLMFPIFDRNGDVLAMGGRFLRGDPEKSPKYLNSGDLIHYHKGQTLYAFNFAKASIREKKTVILCEGYMDCIAYHQCGITWAVAPLGTALTEDQISIFQPYVESVYLSMDSDGAGQNATIKDILMLRKRDIPCKVIILSGGKDPAEIMLNYGKETLTNDVDKAILDSDFLINRLSSLYPKNSPEGKTKALRDFFPYLDALQSDVQKNACLEQFCQAFDISLEAAALDYKNRKQVNPQNYRKDNNTVQTQELKPEKINPNAELRAVMSTVADDVSLFNKMRNEVSVDDLENARAKELFCILEECSRSDNFSVVNIATHCEDDSMRKEIFSTLDGFKGKQEAIVDDSIKLIKGRKLKRQSDEILNRIKRLERSNLPEDKIQLRDLLIQKQEINKQIENLKG